MRLFILGLIFSIFSYPSFAQDVAGSTGLPVDLPSMKSQFGQCSEIRSYVLRLQCFDRIAEDMGIVRLEKTETGLATFGRWHAVDVVSAGGEHTTTMHLPANRPYRAQSGDEYTPELILSCKAKHTDMYIDWKAPISNTLLLKSLDVVYIFDNDVGVSTSWEVSLDRNAVYIPQTMQFIQSMHGKKVLIVQMSLTQYIGMVSMTFTLDGLEDVLKMMAQRCYN